MTITILQDGGYRVDITRFATSNGCAKVDLLLSDPKGKQIFLKDIEISISKVRAIWEMVRRADSPKPLAAREILAHVFGIADGILEIARETKNARSS